MTQQTTQMERIAFAAEWQAKQALRAGRKAQELHRIADTVGLPDAESKTRAAALSYEEEFAVHQNKMFDVLEAAPYPYLTTSELVRHVGRGKAMVLRIERPLINLALNGH